MDPSRTGPRRRTDADGRGTAEGAGIELRAGSAPSMARWRKKLFIATSTITADAAEYFHLPRERTLIIGSTVAL